MVPTTHRRTVTVTLCAVALVAVSGCGGGDGVTSSTATTVSTAPGSSAAGQAYSSKAFVVPLSVAVDAALKSPPSPDSPNLLSWDAAASEDNKVRFLVPVVVYPQAVPRRKPLPRTT